MGEMVGESLSPEDGSNAALAPFRSTKNPPQKHHFPSDLHHIEILNVANDSCMEY